MTRIDRFVLMRLGSRMAATVLVFYGLIVLVEALDTWRFNTVANAFGTGSAVVMVLASAARWTIKTLPVTVLLGAIIGLVDLKGRHEWTVIAASGLSVWRIARAPLIALVLASLVVATLAESWSTGIVREFAPLRPGEASLLGPRGEIWLEQRHEEARYIMAAEGMEASGTRLVGVSVFPIGTGESTRIEGPLAELRAGRWIMPEGILHALGAPPRPVADFVLPTTSSAAEIRLRLTSVQDMTFFELAALIGAGVTDPAIAAAALTRFVKLLAMPLTLAGSLLIAFAFTAGYRSSAKYGPAVLNGMVLGFLVFIVGEMSERAGSGGVFDPMLAAIGPAFAAIVVGVTVLLFREDGRA